MNLLAIDTALENCSVGIALPGAAPVLRSETIGRGHAERLPGMIDAAMREAGISFAELDRIAVTVGPGSFTGLRVGVAAARGIALVVGCPVAGIGTLAVLAESAREIVGPVPVLALLDARRGEVYGQAFDAGGAAIGETEVGSPACFAGRIPAGAVLAGSGANLVAKETGARIAHRQAAPEIAALIRVGLAAPAPTEKPKPVYIRPPDAKPQTGAGIVARR
jgi:tRNA threonylcarbamoyladenosine biosynthesis protein TsaB